VLQAGRFGRSLRRFHQKGSMRELGVKIAWKPLVYSIRHRVTTLNHNVQSADYEAPTRGSAAGAAAVTIFGGPSIHGVRM